MKTVLITGAGMGIGAAIARDLAPGNRLLIHYFTSAQEAESLREELAAAAQEVDVFHADLTTDLGCRTLVDHVTARFSSLDVLVNNAGGMVERRSVENLTWDHLLRTFELNVFSTMSLTGLCVPLLRRAKEPCVVNLTSIAMRHGAPTATAYGAAKSAIDSFTRGAAKELAPIRINAVAPGIIDTRFHTRVTTMQMLETWKEATPLRRLGTPRDVANAVRFAVDNSFLTGETIDCNGGLFMR